MEPSKYPGSSGTRNLHDNLSDLRAQVAANQKVLFLKHHCRHVTVMWPTGDPSRERTDWLLRIGRGPSLHEIHTGKLEISNPKVLNFKFRLKENAEIAVRDMLKEIANRTKVLLPILTNSFPYHQRLSPVPLVLRLRISWTTELKLKCV